MTDHVGPGSRHPDKGEGWQTGGVTVVKRQLGTTVDMERGLFLLAVCVTCVTWVVVEVVTQELVAVMRHSVEV